MSTRGKGSAWHSWLRAPAVAGSFYPSEPTELASLIDGYLQQNHTLVMSRPKAIIVPHAGYKFSGPVAAVAYAQLIPVAETVERIVLLGPAHHVGFRGLAVCDATVFETPLGRVPVDIESVDRVLSFKQVQLLDKAHAAEHSLEVQLPFLQTVLANEFLLTPMVVGHANTREVAEVLDALWDGEKTLLVVSSDLSHYHDYETAKKLDQETTRRIETLQAEKIGSEEACGYAGIRGLLACVASRQLKVRALDVRNSGDTAGPHDRVVGYGAYIVHV